MYRKLVWCYVLILTLLDISFNTNLTAHGKSHGSVDSDDFMEGVNIHQGWDALPAEGADGAEGEAQSAAALSALLLQPPALAFGPRELGVAHALRVAVTNVGNDTLHFASITGTTADFHASFFESKSLPPGGNTSFTVVFLGRHEGAARAPLRLHTSLGMRLYQLSAEGCGSSWELWPLALRVPLNATLQPLLSLRNPTHHTVQVSEVYSSGAWLRLALPGGEARAGRGAWAVPPRGARALVRLRVALPPQHYQRGGAQPLTAFIRIKTNLTRAEGAEGALVLLVQAWGGAAGEHAQPPHVRVRARGSGDPPDTFTIALGNSAAARAPLAGAVHARCAAAPPPAPPALPAPPAPDEPPDRPTANGAHAHAQAQAQAPAPAADARALGGVTLALDRTELAPLLEPEPVARLTLDYAKLWEQFVAQEGDAAAQHAHCWGWVQLGRAALPYSVRLLRGTLRLQPAALEFVTGAAGGAARREAPVRAHNEFAHALRLDALELGPGAEEHFHVSGFEPRVLAPGESAVVLSVRVRERTLLRAPPALSARLVLRSDAARYELPLHLYRGHLHLEWEWPNSADGTLRVGAVGTSSTRRVRARLHNAAPVPQCVRGLRAELRGAGAAAALPACAPLHDPPPDHPCRCIAAGAHGALELTLVAPARAGALRGALLLRTPGGARSHVLQLSAHRGALRAPELQLPPAAPYAWAEAPLLLDNSMELPMRVTGVRQGGAHDPALSYVPPAGGAGGAGAGEEPGAGAAEWAVRAGRAAAGAVRYAPERACAPRCYHGLKFVSAEGQAWLARAELSALSEEQLLLEAALLHERALLFEQQEQLRNVSLLVHTTQVAQVEARGALRLQWLRVRGAGDAGWAGLAGVRAAAALRVRAANPSRSHALLLHAVLGPAVPLPARASTESAHCAREPCAYAADAFRLSAWRALRGRVTPWRAPAGARGVPALLLAPDAELELRLEFAPRVAAALTGWLYLRNNLTVLESVQLAGVGMHASFELDTQRPGGDAIELHVRKCEEEQRPVLARNTGRVPVRLRDWRVAGRACAGRGFRVPCDTLALAPNESRVITLAYAPDWTLARASAPLQLRSDAGEHVFTLRGFTPAALLRRCAREAPRAPLESALRAGGSLLALGLLALVLAAAALDAERLLRRARHARAAHAPPPGSRRAPLDLRALAHEPPAPAPVARAPPPPPARRRRARRADPLAESRAFERWRDALRRPDDEPSSEDAEELAPPPASPAPSPSPTPSPSPSPSPSLSPPCSPPRSSASGGSAGSGEDDASSGSDSSSPLERYDADAEADESLAPGYASSRCSSSGGRGSPARAAPGSAHAPDAAPARARARRDVGGTPRRAERRHAAGSPDADAAPRRAHGGGASARVRKDKAGKRRAGAPPTPPPPPRASPPMPAPAAAVAGAGVGAGAGAVRAGASWSSVVAQGRAEAPPSPPAARASPAAGDHSLFYYSGAAPARGSSPGAVGTPLRADDEFAWRATPGAELAAFAEPTHDYVEESGAGAFGSIGSVWGGSLAARAPGAWPWDAYAAPDRAPAPLPVPAMRPPPGFGATPARAPPAAPPAPAARAFDPFHSLASIWARTALDWRRDSPSPPPGAPAPAPPPARDR